MENSIRLGQYALSRLAEMQARYPIIHDIRGLGLQMATELRRDGKPATVEADTILYHSLSRGLSYKVGGGCVLTLCPPMTINQQQLDQALDIIEEGIKSVN